MKIESLRDLTKDELLQKQHDLKEELFNLNMRKALKELDNPLKLRTIRRDIARIETLITEDANKKGKYCGACHDGKTAFGHTGDNCDKCPQNLN